MFRKKVDKSITKVDKIVTGLIIWWALASIFWASQTSLWKKVFLKITGVLKKTFCFSYSLFWKWLVKIIWVFKRKK